MNESDAPMLRRWLLHQLPADQAGPLEERLLQDDAFGACVRAAETDLLDDFARDRLGAADRAAVARYLLASPENRGRLRFAAALAQRVSAKPAAAPMASKAASAPRIRPAHGPSRHRRAIAWGGLAAACAVVLAVVIVVRHNPQAPEAAAPTIATISLVDPNRGTTVPEVRVPRDTQTIRLQAEVGTQSSAARYTLTIAAGPHTLFHARNLVPREAGPYSYVQVEMKARVLGDGDRRISVAQQGSTANAVWVIHVAANAPQPAAAVEP